MAKIIDFKTRKVLADLEYKRTPRRTMGYTSDDGILKGKVCIIAKDGSTALDIFNQIYKALGVDNDKAKAS